MGPRCCVPQRDPSQSAVGMISGWLAAFHPFGNNKAYLYLEEC